jgi:4'-phosphopantetheinyl transferase EntD
LPIFYQEDINPHTRLGIWKITEDESFFLQEVPFTEGVNHPFKRLQHLAGRYLLQYLFPDFPYEEILIADTRKPYLPHEQYHFSISHSGSYAAAIVSRQQRAGIDIELYSPKTALVKDKFLSEGEQSLLEHLLTGNHQPAIDCTLLSTKHQLFTLLWCAKEAVYKYWGAGGIDFKKHICIQAVSTTAQQIDVLFTKQDKQLIIHYFLFETLCLAWTASN